MAIFEYKDYKKYLADLIASQRGQRGYQTKMAVAAGCQKAFVSQVLYGSVHLTFDHAVGLCKFWQFKPDETEYFIELLQFARAGTPALREYTLRRIEELRSKQSELSAKFKSTAKMSEQLQTTYYSNPVYAAVHVLTSIPAFQKDLSIAQRLQLPLHQVSQVLVELEGMGLLEKKKGERWVPVERNLFLPRQSHMTYMHHSNWRLKALADIQENPAGSIHYSSLHALSEKDGEVLRQMVLDFLKSAKAVIEPSPEEQMLCLCVDYFQV